MKNFNKKLTLFTIALIATQTMKPEFNISLPTTQAEFGYIADTISDKISEVAFPLLKNMLQNVKVASALVSEKSSQLAAHTLFEFNRLDKVDKFVLGVVSSVLLVSMFDYIIQPKKIYTDKYGTKYYYTAYGYRIYCP